MCDMGCPACRMASRMPKVWTCGQEPLIQFLPVVQDEAGEIVIDASQSDMVLMQIVFPVTRSRLLDVSAAADVSKWWPNLGEQVAAALKDVPDFPVARSGPFFPQSPGSDDPYRSLEMYVVIPMPRLMIQDDGFDVIAAIMPIIVEDAAHQIRAYQMARITGMAV